jgi:hypothetical protein
VGETAIIPKRAAHRESCSLSPHYLEGAG